MASPIRESYSFSPHGFVVGDLLYATGGTPAYAKAKADASSTAIVDGLVERVINTATCIIIRSTGKSGYVSGLSGLTANSQYYLSASTAGAAVSTRPTTAGQYVVPVYKTMSSTSLIFNPGDPVLIDSFNTPSLSIASDTTVTEIQLLSYGVFNCQNSTPITITLPNTGTLNSNKRISVVIEADGGGDVTVYAGPNLSINGLTNSTITLSGLLKEQGFLIHNAGQSDWTFMQM